jgi:hypothetical protein
VICAAPARLAGQSRSSYLKVMLRPLHQGSLPQAGIMARRPPRGVAFVVIASSAVVFVAMLVAAVALWIRYGTAVFFEMIAAGLAACF